MTCPRRTRLLARAGWSVLCTLSIAAWILSATPVPLESGPGRAPQLRDHDGPPASYMMVVAHSANGEVARWSGPIDLSVTGPTRFTATRGSNAWTWEPTPPGPFHVASPDRVQGGQPVDTWAESQGANRVVVVVIPYPGEPEDDAGRTGTGTHGQGTGGGRPSGSAHDPAGRYASGPAGRPEAPPAEHIDEIMDYMPEEVELAFYRDLGDRAHQRVVTYERAVQNLRDARDDAGKYAHRISSENHAAWREIRAACDERIQTLQPAATSAPVPGAAVHSPTAITGPAHTISGGATGGLTPVLTGLRGEARVRAVYPIGPRKMIKINGRWRIPDGVTEKVLTEVKNVKKQSFTQQLKDYLAISQEHGLEFHLFVRHDTELSEPLLEAIEQDLIQRRFIP